MISVTCKKWLKFPVSLVGIDIVVTFPTSCTVGVQGANGLAIRGIGGDDPFDRVAFSFDGTWEKKACSRYFHYYIGCFSLGWVYLLTVKNQSNPILVAFRAYLQFD